MSKATLNQSQELLKLVSQSGIGRDQLQALLESGRFSSLIREFMGPVYPELRIISYRIGVDYISLAEMIKAGNYTWIEAFPELNKIPFKRRENGVVKIHFVHFGCDMEEQDVLAELDRRNLQPAQLPELLASGAAFSSDLPAEHLVSLGSRLHIDDEDYVLVPLLHRVDSGLVLEFGSTKGPHTPWDSGWTFLAVCK